MRKKRTEYEFERGQGMKRRINWQTENCSFSMKGLDLWRVWSSRRTSEGNLLTLLQQTCQNFQSQHYRVGVWGMDVPDSCECECMHWSWWRVPLADSCWEWAWRSRITFFTSFFLNIKCFLCCSSHSRLSVFNSTQFSFIYMAWYHKKRTPLGLIFYFIFC